MNCTNFLSLSDYDQATYLAELIHSCQSDNDLFNKGQMIINAAKKMGIFDNVKIGHEAVHEVIPNKEE